VLKKVNLFVNLEVVVFPFGSVDSLKCYGPFIVVSVLVSCLFGSVSLLDTAFAENGVSWQLGCSEVGLISSGLRQKPCATESTSASSVTAVLTLQWYFGCRQEDSSAWFFFWACTLFITTVYNLHVLWPPGNRLFLVLKCT